MALNGRGGSPTHNSAGATVKNTKIKLGGGSIAKNNTNFSKGKMGKIGGLAVKSKGEVITNPAFDLLHNTGRPDTKASIKKKLPSGMTQPTAKKLPIVGKQQDQSNTTSQTVKNLASYLKRKEQGKIR